MQKIYSHILTPDRVGTCRNNLDDFVLLNTGRNAFEYLIRLNNYKHIYLPYYSCGVLIEPLIRNGIKFSYYKINENFEPVFDMDIIKDSCVLLINYFGLKSERLIETAVHLENVIIDNSHLFFTEWENKYLDAFFSPRKFFGITDGGAVKTLKPYNQSLIKNESIKMSILYKGISEREFSRRESLLSNQPITIMSEESRTILQSLDLMEIREIRRRNFSIMQETLGGINDLNLPSNFEGLFYPLKTEYRLREALRRAGIVVPIYWQNVFKITNAADLERNLVKNIYLLPIDHQKDETKMMLISKTLKDILNK